MSENDCQGEGPEFVERAHRDKLKEKIREKIGIELCSVCSDSGLCLKDNGYCSCAEEADLALTAIEDAGYVLMPKDQILRKMSKDMTERKAGNSRLVYNKVTRTIDTVRTADIDVCQADAGAKGETVSREGALQAAAGGDAGIWTPEMKSAAMQDAQNVCDLSMLMRKMLRRIEKGLPLEDLASKTEDFMQRKGLNGSVLRGMNEEAQRADTERPANAESSLTPQIPSPPQEKENGDV